MTIGATYSLQLKKQVGSIVPGKLANFTILAANPLRVDPVRIKDIRVWGTVQEGRVLPVRRPPGQGERTLLGPVLDRQTLEAVHRAEASAAGDEHGDSCTLAQRLAAIAADGLVPGAVRPR